MLKNKIVNVKSSKKNGYRADDGFRFRKIQVICACASRKFSRLNQEINA